MDHQPVGRDAASRGRVETPSTSSPGPDELAPVGLDELVPELVQWIRAVACRELPAGECDDGVQEAFLMILRWGRLESLRHRPYIAQIARNACRRVRASRSRSMSLEVVLKAGTEVAASVAIEASDRRGEGIPGEWREELCRQISRRHRDVLDLMDMSIEEISSRLGRSPRSVSRSVDVLLGSVGRLRSRPAGAREET